MAIIIDSKLSITEALLGKEFPEDVRESLTIIDIQHISFDSEIHIGQLIVHKNVADEVKDIFQELFELRFPILKIIPVSFYDWDDERSMEDNNSSAFNYRVIHGTSELSNHSYGLAIDINPKLNPYVARDGSVFPKNATHDFDAPGTFSPESTVIKAFTSRGWSWGGDWDRKDWQHFEKK